MRTSMEKLNVGCIDGKIAVMKLFKEGNNKMRAQKQAALPIKGKTQMNGEALLERHKRISSGMCVQTNRIKNFPVPVVYLCRAGFIKNGNRLQSKRKISILFFNHFKGTKTNFREGYVLLFVQRFVSPLLLLATALPSLIRQIFK